MDDRTRARRARLALVGVPLVVVALALLAGQLRLRSAAEPSATSTAEVRQRAALALQDVGTSLDADPTYGGVRITATGVEVSVVGTPSGPVQAAVEGLRSRVPVRVRPVRNGLAALTALTSRLDREHARWHGEGVELSGWGPDVESNRVSVTLARYSDAAAERLRTAYGPGLLRVERGDVVNVPADASSLG